MVSTVDAINDHATVAASESDIEPDARVVFLFSPVPVALMRHALALN